MNLLVAFPGSLTDQLCCPLPEEIRDNLSHIFFSGSSSLPLHGFILHPIRECPLTGKQFFTLQVAVHHQDCRRVVVHFPDNHGHGIFPGKLGSVMPSVAGDHFIAAIRRRPRNSGNHDTVPAYAFHGPFHGFVIQHFERVIFERMQLGKRYFLHLLRRLVSTAFLGRENVIVAAQADVCAFFRHWPAPPLSVSDMPPRLSLWDHAGKCFSLRN